MHSTVSFSRVVLYCLAAREHVLVVLIIDSHYCTMSHSTTLSLTLTVVFHSVICKTGIVSEWMRSVDNWSKDSQLRMANRKFQHLSNIHSLPEGAGQKEAIHRLPLRKRNGSYFDYLQGNASLLAVPQVFITKLILPVSYFNISALLF